MTEMGADEPFILLAGDSLERLKALPDASIDACVTDPPYGLSEHRPEDVAACLAAWLAGQEYRPKKKGFMGRAWDAWVPGPELWREVYRVLKPGGHLLAMAGSRTQDLMGMAIRLAGFEIRDGCSWLYGSGFPKSLDVGKAIDKCNGEIDRLHRFTAWMRATGLTASRINAVTGTFMGSHYLTDKSQPAIPTCELWSMLRPLCGDVPSWVDELVKRIEAERKVMAERTMTQGGGSALQIRMGERREVEANITAPATDAAKQWDGWGTALKPSKEPVIVARKPPEGTVAANVVKYGTGGLNIDGCRVDGAPQVPGSGGFKGGDSQTYGRGLNDTAARRAAAYRENPPAGRWPPNVLLSHARGCVQVGFATVAGDARSNNPEATDGERPGGFGDIGADKGEGKPNAAVYGNEEVPVWACVPGCPVRALDDQAGFRKSGTGAVKRKSSKDQEGNQGTALGKESRPEGTVMITYGDAGAVSRFFPILPIDDPTLPPFFYSAKTSTAERNVGLPEGVTNKHPTVKPLALCRWLLRLVVPPGGVVLDPFCGSGSFGCAAMMEGFGFVGIDLDAEHIQVSRFRILSAWRGSRTEP